ncbi:MAG: hypothetical protein P8K80_07500 [Phycisphaerales bacterium]|nr:hypothetical protein [Phycisphaerales bacterium]
MNTRNNLSIAAVLVALSCLATNATADLVQATTWNGGGDEHHWTKAIGWQFTATNDLDVTHLGVLDLGEAGLGDRHTVGLFNSAGDLLVSSTISAGLNGDLMLDSMIYNSVDVTSLQKNETYYILADNWNAGQDAFTFGWNTVDFSNDIDWMGFSESTGGSIFDPVVHFNNGEPGNIGPGFMYRVAPSPGALALLGLAGIASRRRRR